MLGILTERPSGQYPELRERVLRQNEWFRWPLGCNPQSAAAGNLANIAPTLKSGLEAYGVVSLKLDRLLSNDEFIRVANALGAPQLLRDPRMQGYVEDGVVLNLRADHPETHDRTVDLLFAENYVMAHTELSAMPTGAQPRYLMFQCMEPPARDAGGQTLLMPMDVVRSRLSSEQAQILMATGYASYPDAPPFLRQERHRYVFSFKDAGGEVVPWRYEPSVAGVKSVDVNRALQALLTAIYQPDGVFGLHWERYMLGVFDNTRFFHARTFVQRLDRKPPRQLREIRIARPTD